MSSVPSPPVTQPLWPLSPASILLVLELISHSLPSPIPPYLLSSALRQRHYFLQISPSDTVEYLTWPSEAEQQITHLIESLPKPTDHPNFSVRYSADVESTFAHAAIPSADPPGLRLIFQWESASWKYHNIALMPFPPYTFESVEAIQAMYLKPCDFMTEPRTTAEDEDSYWDAYDRDDDIKTEQTIAAHGTEDAYWARYTSVHGSADSAIPTPPIDASEQRGRVVLPFPEQRLSAIYNPLAPPSPRTLTRHLADLQQRSESPLLEDSDSGFGSSLSSVSSPPEDSDLERPSLSLQRTVIKETTDTPTTEGDESSRTLKDAVRSIYHLWQLGKPRGSSAFDDAEEFLDIVREVLAESTP